MLIKISFTPDELQLVIDALGRSSNRLESMARFYPRNYAAHGGKARAMRELRARLTMEPSDPVMDWNKAKQAR